MKQISMIQNTDDWYKMRNSYIGASEANIIMGLSEFKTPLQLWKQKTGEAQDGNKSPDFIQAKGHKMEAKMRPFMEMIYDTDLEPIVVVNDDYKFLMASLDGYSEKLSANWEHKYVGQEDYEKVSNGEMLMHYYPQVQQQLLLTGATKCIFSVCTDNKESENKDFPYKYAYIEVKPDHNYIQSELLPKLQEFWDMVRTKISPELGDKDTVDMSENEVLTQTLADYLSVQEQVKALSELDKTLYTKIFKIVGKAKKVVCNGTKITQSKSDDKIVADYDAFLKKITGLKEKEDIEKRILNELCTKEVKGRITKRITFPKDKK